MSSGVPSSRPPRVTVSRVQSLADTSEVDGLVPPAANPLTVTTPEEAPVLSREEEDEVVELMNIGRKEEVKDILGHRVHFRTLTVDEELQVALLTKPYLNTDGYGRAFKTAVVAASVRSIDNVPVYTPLEPESLRDQVAKKFEIFKHYFPLAVDQLFAGHREIELTLVALAEKLGKSRG